MWGGWGWELSFIALQGSTGAFLRNLAKKTKVRVGPGRWHNKEVKCAGRRRRQICKSGRAKHLGPTARSGAGSFLLPRRENRSAAGACGHTRAGVCGMHRLPKARGLGPPELPFPRSVPASRGLQGRLRAPRPGPAGRGGARRKRGRFGRIEKRRWAPRTGVKGIPTDDASVFAFPGAGVGWRQPRPVAN